MSEDAIIKELQDVKDRHAAEYGYDIDKMVHSLQKQQRESGRRIVCLKPRPIATDEAG